MKPHVITLNGNTTPLNIQVVRENEFNMSIAPEGHLTPDGMPPISIDYWDGKVRVLVYTDPASDEPTHRIEIPKTVAPVPPA